MKDKGIKMKTNQNSNFTEIERTILEATAKKFKWIVRNPNGELELMARKPQKEPSGHWSVSVKKMSEFHTLRTKFNAFDHLFKSVTNDDLEPKKIR